MARVSFMYNPLIVQLTGLMILSPMGKINPVIIAK